MIEHVIRDLRYGSRGLWRDRTFTATTVSTLAVALALVTIVFTIFNAYVLRPFAVRDPYSLYEIRWRSQGAAGRTFRWNDYDELRRRQDLFDDVIAERDQSVSLEGRPVLAAFVSGNYFEALGGRLRLGRGLAPFDARSPGDAAVAVLSYEGWKRFLDSDPAAVGRPLRLNDQTFLVVGVADQTFTGLNDTPPDLWVPATMYGPVNKQELFGSNQPRELAVIARVRRDMTPAQVEQALQPFMERAVDRTDGARAQLVLQSTPAPLTLKLLAMLSPVFAAFVLVLVTACANVSNVMLARATTRQREIGIRLSVGASRSRVVRQLLTEGLLISVLAGLAALGLASLAIRTGLAVFFLTLPPSAAAVARVVPLDFDYRVFAFTSIVAAATTVVFALLPALQSTRLAVTHALRGEIHGAIRSSRLRSLFVVSQVAVSLVLVIVAATLAHNAVVIGRTNLGLSTDNVVAVKQRSRGDDLIRRTYAALSADSRVDRVAVTSKNPLSGELPKTPLLISDTPALIAASYMFVSPEYFSTVRIPLLAGRCFTVAEAASEAHVGVISAAAAARLWPGLDPLGRTLRALLRKEERSDLTRVRELRPIGDLASEGFDVTVVGVAQDVVSGLLYEGPDAAHLYLPTAVGAPHAKALLVKGRSVQDLRPDALQAVLRTVDPNPLAFDVLTLDEALTLQMYPLRVASWIGLILSSIALALSIFGVYGVMAYAVRQRTREIGIRMALGATSRHVVRLLMKESTRLVAIGAGFGLLVSLAALGTLRAIITLRNVSTLDTTAFAAGLLMVATAGALAAFVPVRRATDVDPAEALRAEG